MADFEIDERVDITDVVCDDICKSKSSNGRD